MNSRWMLSLTLVFLLTATVLSQEKQDTWARFRFLAGDWAATGGGAPGQATGEFSFALDLQNKVMVRKSHTSYPAAGGRPAFAHDDLMILYATGDDVRADYYDNEGHVIRYAVEVAGDGQTITFLSDPIASQPRFRLTYVRRPANELTIRFEIAAPNTTEFKVYVEGTAQKK